MSNKQHEMIFGLHEDAIVDAFGAKVFNLNRLLGQAELEMIDAAVMGVSRRNQAAVDGFAPLVTYGIAVKRLAGNNKAYDQLMDVRGASNDVNKPRIAVYRQRKLDSNLRESYVLSIGVSGDVFKGDLDNIKGPNEVGLFYTLRFAARRKYGAMVEASYQSTLHGAKDELNLSLDKSDSLSFHFFRDGVKKPGYAGTAHIGAAYFVPFRADAELLYVHPDYTHMGWFTLEDLQAVLAAQEALQEAGHPVTPETFRFTDPALQLRIGRLVFTRFEPWSAQLIMNDDKFKSLINQINY